MTVTLGWWLIPTIASVFILLNSGDTGGFMSGLGYILAIIPISIIWLVYCILNIWFGVV